MTIPSAFYRHFLQNSTALVGVSMRAAAPVAAAVGLALLSSGSGAYAQSIPDTGVPLTWTGGGASSSWSDNGNWVVTGTSANAAPDYHTYNDLHFAGTAMTATDDIVGFVDPYRIEFDPRSANGTTATGSFILTGLSEGLGGGGIVNNSTATQTIAFNTAQFETNSQQYYSGLVPEDSSTFNAASGDLVIQSNIQAFTNPVTITVTGAHNTTISGNITEPTTGAGVGPTGPITIVKTGTGTLVLSGANNGSFDAANVINEPGFSGGIQVQGGIVQLSHTDLTGVIDAAGSGAITLAGGAVQATQTSTLNNAFSVTAGTTGTILASAGTTFTLGSNFNGAGAAIAGNLKVGSAAAPGTVAFNLQNFTGANVGPNATFEAVAGTALDTNGSLAAITGVATATRVAAGATLNLATFGSTGGGILNLQNGSAAGDTGGTVQWTANPLQVQGGTFSGNLAGDGGLNKTSAATLTLINATTYTGGTTLTDGIVNVRNNLALGDDSNVITFTGGTLQAGTAGLDIAYTAQLTGTGGVIDSNGRALTYSGLIRDGVDAGVPLVIEGGPGGNGVLTLTANNTFTGPAFIDSGTLALTGVGSIARSVGLVMGTNTVFDIAGTNTGASVQTLVSNDGTALVNLGAKTLTFTAAGSDYAGVIQGTGNIVVSGGVQGLSGVNTFTGTATVNTGATLAIDGNGSIATASGVVDNGSFNIAGANGPVSVATLSGTNAAATTVLGNNTLALTAAAGTFAGTISGNGGLTVQAGTETLTGDNTFAGPTTVASGAVVNLGAGGTTGRISGPAAVDGNLVFNHSDDVTYAGTISGAGTVTKLNTDALTLTGPNSYRGGTTLTSGTIVIGNNTALGTGTLAMAEGTTLSFLTDAAYTVGNRITLAGDPTFTVNAGPAQTISGPITDATPGNPPGVLEKNGAGTLILTGTNTYSGGTIIQAGTLQLGNGGTTGSILNNVIDNGTLAFDRSDDVIFPGAISGTGSVAQIGAGSTRLSNANTYAGGTTITGGTLIGSTTSFGTGGVVDNAALVIDQPTDAAFNNPISGFGTLTKQGVGVLTLSGNNSLTGNTTVAAGTLLVTGSTATSAVTVANGATLGGNGVVGGINAQSGGRVAPGIATPYTTLTVNGNVAFANGSVFQVAVNPNTQTDKVLATGTATLTGGTVAVQGAAGAYANQTRYTILTANAGVTGTFTDVTSNIAILTPSLRYDGNNAFLFLTRNDLTFAQLGNTPNQQSTGTGSDVAFRIGTPIYDALLLLNPNQVPAALDALSGEIHASAATAGLQSTRLVREAINDRLWTDPCTNAAYGALVDPVSGRPVRAVTPGANCVPGQPFALWGQGFGEWARNRGNSNVATLEQSTGGFVIGGDARLDGTALNNWRVGLFGGYTNDSLTISARSSSGTFESFFGGVYGAGQYGPVNVRLGSSFGGTSTRTDRQVAFPGFLDNEKSNYGGDIVQGFGEIGYRIPVSLGFVEPIAGAAAIHLDQDGFRESGQSAALLGRPTGYDVETATLGVRAESGFLANTPLLARGFLGWQHAFGDINPAIREAFVAGGPDFSITGAPIDADALVAQAGLDYIASGQLTLGVSYSGAFGNRTDDNAVKGRAEYRF